MDPLTSPEPATPPQDRTAKPPQTFTSGVLYGASLPERLVRGMIGAASGILKESAEAVVPDAMKGSKLYELAVRKMLRRLVEDVGGLKAIGPATEESPAAGTGTTDRGTAAPGTDTAAPGTDTAAPGTGAGTADTSAAHLAVSSAVDIAGMTALHLSPLWVLAVVSDVALGARTYLQALVKELKTQGVIEGSAAVESVDDLLATLQQVSGTAADKLDTPPLTLKELRRSVDQLRSESKKVDLAKMLPTEEMDRLWREIQATATREGCSVFEVSSAMAMMALGRVAQAGKGAYGSVKVGFDLLNDNVLQYYADSLARIHEKGLYQTLAETYEPYLRCLRHLFEPSTSTYTEEMLTGRLFTRLWRWMRTWFQSRLRKRRQKASRQGRGK